MISIWGQLEYYCLSETCELDNMRNVTNITGTHLRGKSNEDVAWFRILGCDMDFIPEGITNVFPNLVVLTIHYTAIKTLNGDELKDYSRLELLDITHSKIERIPGNFLQYTPDLIQVSFLNNEIMEVGENLLDNLPNLTSVFFQRNICINRDADRENIHVIKDIFRNNCSIVGEITTTQAPVCQIGNINERICVSEWNIERLLQKYVEILEELKLTKKENIEIRQRLQNIENLFRLIDGFGWSGENIIDNHKNE